MDISRYIMLFKKKYNWPLKELLFGSFVFSVTTDTWKVNSPLTAPFLLLLFLDEYDLNTYMNKLVIILQ